MSTVIPVRPEIAEKAWVDKAAYRQLYEQSMADPEGFWAEQGKRIHWFTPYTKVKDVSFGPGDVYIRWYYDGVTNAAYNCIDRHLPEKKDDIAIIWEGDDPSRSEEHTSELQSRGHLVCRLLLEKK